MGEVAGRHVRLEWATEAVDNFGFNLYRASVANRSQADLITSVPSEAVGRAYLHTDTVPSDGLWYYWLADVDTSGSEAFNGPVWAGVGALGLSYRVYLPMVTKE